MNTIGKRIEDEPAGPPAGEGDKTVLGSLGDVPADTTLGDAPATLDPLKLPKGALVAMRKSGGLRFSSRTVIVHRDGRVTQHSSVQVRSLKAPARLNTRQLSVLKRNVVKSMSSATAKSIGQQNPDAFAYEIVARVGRRVVSVEVFDGSIPPALAGLIKDLSRYLPSAR